MLKRYHAVTMAPWPTLMSSICRGASARAALMVTVAITLRLAPECHALLVRESENEHGSSTTRMWLLHLSGQESLRRTRLAVTSIQHRPKWPDCSPRCEGPADLPLWQSTGVCDDRVTLQFVCALWASLGVSINVVIMWYEGPVTVTGVPISSFVPYGLCMVCLSMSSLHGKYQMVAVFVLMVVTWYALEPALSPV